MFRPDGATPLPHDEIPLVRAVRGESVDDAEVLLRLPHLPPDGLLVSVNARPVTDAEGNRRGGVVVFRDVTARRRATVALRSSESRLRSVLGGLSEGVVLQDAAGHIIECNASAERILGLTRDQLEGRTSTDPRWRTVRADLSPFPGEEHPAMVALRTGAPQSDELMGVYKPGQDDPTWITINARPLFHPGGTSPFAVVASFHDITEIKRNVQTFRRLNRLLRTLLEVNQAVLRARSREELFKSVCARLTAEGVATLAWIGLARADGSVEIVRSGGAAREYLTDLQVRCDETVLGQGTTGRAIRTGQPQVTQDVAADPRMAPWRERLLAHGLHSSGAFPLRIGERTIGALSVYITDREGVGEEEVRLFTQLAEGISFALESLARAEEQRETQRQLLQSQKMDAIGRLAGGIAHDFNNLLGVILGYADLLRDRPQASAEDRADIDQVHRAAERAAELTRRLLAFSRQQAFHPKLVELNALVRDMERMLRRLIGEHIELEVSLGAGCGRLMADAGQLEQVVMNLVINARDAMPRGGRLAIRTRAAAGADVPESAMGEPRPGQYVELTVQDSGAGMDEAMRSRIFEPFFTTKGPEHGTGLGLATVFGIVMQHGGRIQVDSAPGAGSSFRVFLPCSTDAARVEPPRPAVALPRGTETVLVVEDEPALRLLVERTLRECGYRVLSAASGEEALAIAESHAGPIDLLLTDVVMPRMGGRELAERLRARRGRTRELYMSGYAPDALADAAAVGERIALLQKPFTREELARRVRQALD